MSKSKKTPKELPTIQSVAFEIFKRRGVDDATYAEVQRAIRTKCKVSHPPDVNGIAKLRSLYRAAHGGGAVYGSRVDNLRTRIENLEKAFRALGGRLPRAVFSRKNLSKKLGRPKTKRKSVVKAKTAPKRVAKKTTKPRVRKPKSASIVETPEVKEPIAA